MHWLTVFVFFAATIFNSYGQSPFPWPKKLAVQPVLKWQEITHAQRPSGIGWMINSDEPPEELAQETTSISYIDLNGDGVPEAIVDNREGGTAGGSCGVYEKIASNYKCIAEIPRGFSFCVRYNGYYQIEGWSRAGGGPLYTRLLYRFQKGRYHLIRLEDYRGEGDNAEYLDSRSPAKNDIDPVGGDWD